MSETPRAEDIEEYQRRQYSLIWKGWIVLCPVVLFVPVVLVPVSSWGDSDRKIYVLAILTVCILANGLVQMAFTVREVFHPQARIGWPICELTSFALATILAYALDYRVLGIKPTASGDPVTAWDSIYFSIITWTTVGYGDFVPTPTTRAFAASEALLGYLFTGLYVATLFQVLVMTGPRVWARPEEDSQSPARTGNEQNIQRDRSRSKNRSQRRR